MQTEFEFVNMAIVPDGDTVPYDDYADFAVLFKDYSTWERVNTFITQKSWGHKGVISLLEKALKHYNTYRQFVDDALEIVNKPREERVIKKSMKSARKQMEAVLNAYTDVGFWQYVHSCIDPALEGSRNEVIQAVLDKFYPLN